MLHHSVPLLGILNKNAAIKKHFLKRFGEENKFSLTSD
jgi:hypothetical protein